MGVFVEDVSAADDTDAEAACPSTRARVIHGDIVTDSARSAPAFRRAISSCTRPPWRRAVGGSVYNPARTATNGRLVAQAIRRALLGLSLVVLCAAGLPARRTGRGER